MFKPYSFYRYGKPHIPTILPVSIILYLIGTAFGYLCGNLLRNSLFTPVQETYQTLLQQIATTKIASFSLFGLCLKQHLKQFILLIFFAFTNVWVFYLSGFLLFSGFSSGLLLLFCILLQGPMGIWEFLCFSLPQALVFVPLYLRMICKLHCHHPELQKGQSLFKVLPSLLVFLGFLLLGCILESTANVPLLRWYLGLK